MNDIIQTLEYKDFVNSIIEKIQNAHYESLKLVNKNLIQLYWDIDKSPDSAITIKAKFGESNKKRAQQGELEGAFGLSQL